MKWGFDISFLLLIFFSGSLSAQDVYEGLTSSDSSLLDFAYNPFPDTSARFFKSSNDEIYAIKPEMTFGDELVTITSPESITDFFDFWDIDYRTCYTDKSSWLFSKVEIKPDGNVVFFTQSSRVGGAGEITIRTQAPLGEVWITIGESILGYDVFAEVTELSEMEIFGVLDSVKRISFYADDSDAFDGLYILLGKRTGLLSTVNFLQFDRIDVDWFSAFEKQMNMPVVGIGSAGPGIHNVTILDAFNFQPGDELHIFRRVGSDLSMFNYKMLEEKWYVAERADYSDTVEYLMSVDIRITIVKDGDTTVSVQSQERKPRYFSDESFDNIPGTFAQSDVFPYVDPYTYQGVWNGKDVKFVPNYIVFDGSDDCYQTGYYDGCSVNIRYIRGLGGGYFSCFNAFSGSLYSKELRYYKRQDEEWGVPFDFVVGIAEPSETVDLEVYPNPTSNVLHVRHGGRGDYVVQLFDIYGKLLIYRHIQTAEITLDMSKLASGIYFIKTIGPYRKVASARVVVSK